MQYLFLLIGLLFSLTPQGAEAQVSALQTIVGAVGGPALTSGLLGMNLACPVGNGGCVLAALLVYVLGRIRALAGTAAFLIIVVAGFRLIISQNEEALTTARRAVVGAITGLFLIFITESLVEALYGGFGIAAGTRLGSTGAALGGAAILSDELMGILRWGETLVAMTAVTLIIVQAAAVLGSLGAEDTIRKAYRAFFYTVIGILLMVFKEIIASIFGYNIQGALPGPPDATVFVLELMGFVQFALTFVAIIAVAVLTYSGLMMLFNYGNDDLVSKGKTIFFNTALGLALIAVSQVIVKMIIDGLI